MNLEKLAAMTVNDKIIPGYHAKPGMVAYNAFNENLKFPCYIGQPINRKPESYFRVTDENTHVDRDYNFRDARSVSNQILLRVE